MTIQSQLLIADAYKASIAIKTMSDTRDEEKDRKKDQRSKVCYKTPKIQEITVRSIRPVVCLIFNSIIPVLYQSTATCMHKFRLYYSTTYYV